MRNQPIVILCVAVLAVGTAEGRLVAGEFRDGFKGALGPGWSWVRENPKGWRVTENGLEVRVQPGNMWGNANDAKNVMVRPAFDPEKGPVEASVTFTNSPTEQYEQADLVWYYDDANMVKCGQEMVNGTLSVVMGRECGDRCRTIKILPLDSSTVSIRLLADGTHIRGQFKTPKDKDWIDVGECDLPVKGEPKISLQFYQGPRAERWARVNDFLLNQSP